MFQQLVCSRTEWCCFPFADIFWVEFCKDWHECSQKRSSNHYSLWTVCICCIFICLRTGIRNNYCRWYAVYYPGKLMGSVTWKLNAVSFSWLVADVSCRAETELTWDRGTCLELMQLHNFSRFISCFLLPPPLLLPQFFNFLFSFFSLIHCMGELTGENLMGKKML